MLNPYGQEIGKQQLASRPFVVSNQIPSNLSKGSASGTLSAVIFGNFSDLYLGMWGSLEILVDPYSDFSKGTTGVRALQSNDVAVARTDSIAAIQDIYAT